MDKRLLDIAEEMRRYHKKRPSNQAPPHMWDLVSVSILLQHSLAREMAAAEGMMIVYNDVEKKYEYVKE